MKYALIAAAVAAATAASTSVAVAQDAQVGAYGNLNVALVDAGPNLWALGGRLGYRFHTYVGVEGEFGFGIKGDDVTVGAVTAKAKLKHAAAAYVVGFLPVGENTDILARIGYGTSKIKVTALGAGASASEESFNFGVGVQHHFDGQNGVRFDYTRQEFDNGGGDADVLSLGYSRKF